LGDKKQMAEILVDHSQWRILPIFLRSSILG
jgi:hypothetical protein